LIAEKEVKENRKLTLRIISEEAGVSTNSLTAYNNQDVVRFDALVLEAFCKYFNCGVGTFFLRRLIHHFHANFVSSQ